MNGNRCRSSGRTTQGKVRFAPTPVSEPKPEVAIALLRGIVDHRLNKLALFSASNRPMLLQLYSVLGRVMDVLKCRLASTSAFSACSDEFLLNCWKEYHCIGVLLHAKPPSPEKVPSSRSRRHRSKSPEAPTLSAVESSNPLKLIECIDWTSR